MLADGHGAVLRDRNVVDEAGDVPVARECGDGDNDAEERKGSKLAFSSWHLALSN
jgi:hypothetical protein